MQQLKQLAISVLLTAPVFAILATAVRSQPIPPQTLAPNLTHALPGEIDQQTIAP
jgi:hypothetical protein